MFVLVFNNTTQNVVNNPINNTANRVQRESHRKYFLPRVNITNYNALIDGRNFHDQPINDQIKNYDEIRKIAPGKRFRLHNRMFVGLSVLQRSLPINCSLAADPRAIQQIEFYGKLGTNSQVCTVL